MDASVFYFSFSHLPGGLGDLLDMEQSTFYYATMDNNKNNQEQMIKSLPHTPNVLSSFNQQQRPSSSPIYKRRPRQQSKDFNTSRTYEQPLYINDPYHQLPLKNTRCSRRRTPNTKYPRRKTVDRAETRRGS